MTVRVDLTITDDGERYRVDLHAEEDHAGGRGLLWPGPLARELYRALGEKIAMADRMLGKAVDEHA